MERAEYKLFQLIDKKLTYLTRVSSDIEKRMSASDQNSAEIRKEVTKLNTQVAIILPVVEEMRKALSRRKRINRVIAWTCLIAVSAAVSTTVNFFTTGYWESPSKSEIVGEKQDVGVGDR